MAQTDDERWAEAISILDRTPTPSATARQRTRRRTIWLTILGIGLVSGAIGAVVGGLAASSGDFLGVSEPATWQWVVGLALFGTGLIGCIAALVSLIRAGQWGSPWRAPTAVLTRQQRKHLLRQVRGQRPVDPAHLALTLDLARRLVLQRRTALLMGSLLLLWAGQVIVVPDVLRLGLLGFLVVIVAVAVPQLLRDAGRAQRFLDQHDDHRCP